MHPGIRTAAASCCTAAGALHVDHTRVVWQAGEGERARGRVEKMGGREAGLSGGSELGMLPGLCCPGCGVACTQGGTPTTQLGGCKGMSTNHEGDVRGPAEQSSVGLHSPDLQARGLL